MNATYTKTLARNILIAFLVFIIAVSVAAFFVRSSITKKLHRLSTLAGQVKQDQSEPEKYLLLVQQAENQFRETLLTSDISKANHYKVTLTDAINKIDSLIKNSKENADLNSLQSAKIKALYRKKINLSERLLILKRDFDSLLTVYASYSKQIDQSTPTIMSVETAKNKEVKVKTDTVVKVAEVQKKKLLGRIKDAIANKNAAAKEVIEINRSKDSQAANLTTHRIISEDRNHYLRQIRQLQQRNVGLLSMQKELINLNSKISNELEHIVNELKDINYKMADELKELAFSNYKDTTTLLNKFYLVALFLVLVFAILLIVFIIQLNKSEIFLRKENERSVLMAQQKMDLLLHMSHEIRNPLTAIKGFLYIFSRTTLTPRQMEMLDSIRSSSDMLLLTLNDTLDAAKMENSAFKINNDPFNPDYILNQVIESMSYSAAKKNLGMDYIYHGDKQAIVIGDSFRLKQILVNLLSNAIKYTSEGGVKVIAELDGGQGLQVEVTDTGAGISQDQQANLFSKYYQTSSSKGKVGTGLGLYICKQLVELQHGKISVKSNAGKGTTFSFFIPYRENEEVTADQSGTEDALPLLNGMHILAVDDNEINLLFLKAMTKKWNIVFHQASTAEEALDMLSENPIQIILTDIQLPGMDGFAFIKAIRGLKGSKAKLPVIAISGFSSESSAQEFTNKGFSGFVPKPFAEDELVKELLKAAKR
jgi:two-component system sensor histidine kinase BarA